MEEIFSSPNTRIERVIINYDMCGIPGEHFAQHSRDPLVVGKTTILSIIFFICNLPPDSHLLSLDFLLCRHPVGWRWGRGKHTHHHQLFRECCISINLINKNVIKKYFRFFLRVCKIELGLRMTRQDFSQSFMAHWV